VIRTRQYLGALMPLDDALVLDVMRFSQQIVQPDECSLPKGNSKSYRVTPEEVQMATQLLESMSAKWRPDDYRDESRAKLRKIIDEQIARQSGRKVKARAPEPQTAPQGSVLRNWLSDLPGPGCGSTRRGRARSRIRPPFRRACCGIRPASAR
jgi:DNA end-binding protein Ku